MQSSRTRVVVAFLDESRNTLIKPYIYFSSIVPHQLDFSKEGRTGLRKINSLAFVVDAEILSRVIIRAKRQLL